MKKIICLFLIILLISSLAFANDKTSFKDIDNHWAKEDIEKMLRDDAVNGYSGDLFKPDKHITMAEFLKMLIVESNTKLVTEGRRWPDWYVYTAIKERFISADDIENISKELTRKDACRVLGNFIDLSDVKKAQESFIDLSIENKEVILKLVRLEIINGYKDKTFRENEIVTRAQACKLILKSYDAKIELMKNRKYTLTHNNTNIGKNTSGDIIKSRYEIKNNRIYILDIKYGVSNGTTLNQEYIEDKKIINLLNAIVDDNSYTEVLYIKDNYFLNSLNICIGQLESYVNNGDYIFQIRFYENGKYDVAKATDTSTFSHEAFARIELDKMWDRLHEFDSSNRASIKNLYKLEEAIGAILDKNVKKEVATFLSQKLTEASSKEENEFEPKIIESKKFGKYTLDVICTRGTKIEVYISK